MCVVSMVSKAWTDPCSPNYIHFTQTYPDPNLAKALLDILERLESLDKRLGLKDCKEEEARKEELYKDLRQRVLSV